MKKNIVNDIIQTHQLIPGPVSRKILRAIINNEVINENNLPHGITLSQINIIKNLYQEKSNTLEKKITHPKYLPFYHIIKDKIKDFSWEIENNHNIKITAPRINNIRPSLLSFLLEKVDDFHNTLLHQKYRCINQLPFPIIKALDNFFCDTNAIYPRETEMKNIIDTLARCLKGNYLTIFIPICPDYSTESTDDIHFPVRHTFDGLGSGNGQIAQRIINAFPSLKKVVNELQIKTNIVVCMADFEAFSEDNLKRVNLAKEEFISKLQDSKKAFIDACPHNINIHFSMFTELCGGENQWNQYLSTIKNNFALGNFGQTQITKKILLKIAATRRLLYSRWYGKKSSLDEYISIVLNQGAEYAVMGSIIAERYQNCLVIGADNDVMKYFYSFVKTIPTLYLKRYYC